MGGPCPPLLPQFCGDGEVPAPFGLYTTAIHPIILSAILSRNFIRLIRCSNQRGGKRVTHVL
jgi:hypothetical protein